jgi:Acetyltransferases, including N-acetylases of ribosomal proteins
MSSALLERHRVEARTPGPCPVVATSRLVLRPHRLSDADSITESLSDFSVARMLARVPQPYDRQDALDWLQIQVSPSVADWSAAITMGDDVHIGTLSLELRAGAWRLGYWLNRYYWGRGIMTEATGALLDRFFRRMPDVAIESGAFADNAASLKIQQKLGFRITGCSEMYSLSRNAIVAHIDTLLQPEDLRRP